MGDGGIVLHYIIWAKLTPIIRTKTKWRQTKITHGLIVSYWNKVKSNEKMKNEKIKELL